MAKTHISIVDLSRKWLLPAAKQELSSPSATIPLSEKHFR